MEFGESQLNDIFVSHRGFQKNPYTRLLAKLEAQDIIEINRISYEFEGHVSWFLDGASPEGATESNEHKRLKRYAAAYLMDNSCDEVGFELNTWFGVPDVGCKNQHKYAECGKVRVGKFVEAFGLESNIDMLGDRNHSYGVAEEIAYVPFEGNENPPPLTVYSFQRKTI